MRINTEGDRNDIKAAINWMGGIIGSAIDKRVALFEQQEQRNPLLAAYFKENYALEYAFAKARKYRKATGRLPKGDDFHHLYSFALPAHRIHMRLSSQTKVPFEGRLRDAVNGAFGARPFAYEISIATHLMRNGWDVDFADYSGAGRFDFLARQGSNEIEVECKSTSNDTGRKIHRQEVNRLADLILPTVEQLLDARGCHLIRIKVADRLERANEVLTHVASIVSAAVNKRGAAKDDLVDVEYAFEGLSSWPEPMVDDGAREFFESRFSLENIHLLFCGRRGFSVIAVAIASARPDNVVKKISDHAKEAADQCTGTRPALVALHLADRIDTEGLTALLKTPSGLHNIASAVFGGQKRLHVDSIAFTVPPGTGKAARPIGTTVWPSLSA